MKLPQLLPECNHPQFCSTCRDRQNGKPFREFILKHRGIECDVDFECPKGKPWNDEEPTKVEQAKNATKAIASAAKSIVKTQVLRKGRVSDDVYKERLNTCRSCPGNHAVFRNGALFTCGEFKDSITGKLPTCGCVLTKKARDTKQDCPMGYWTPLTVEGKDTK